MVTTKDSVPQKHREFLANGILPLNPFTDGYAYSTNFADWHPNVKCTYEKNLAKSVSQVDEKYYKSVAVARKVGAKELRQETKAQKAMADEWNRLIKIGTWDDREVYEFEAYHRHVLKTGDEFHIGRLLALMVEKKCRT